METGRGSLFYVDRVTLAMEVADADGDGSTQSQVHHEVELRDGAHDLVRG